MINLSFCALAWNSALRDFLPLRYLKTNMMTKKHLRALENFRIWFSEGSAVFLRPSFAYVIGKFRMSFFRSNGATRHALLAFSSYTEKFYANFVSIKNSLVGWISSVRLLVHLKSYKAFHWLLMPTTGRLSKFKLSVRQLLPTNVTPKPRKY